MLLNTKKADDYDIQAALRGPDFNDDELKELTTGVIRHFAGLSTTFAIVMSPSAAKAAWAGYPDTTRSRVTRLWRDNTHFKQHIWYALTALQNKRKPGVKAYREWLEKTLGG